MKPIIIAFLLLFSALCTAYPQAQSTDINPGIALAFKSGDASKLASFFNNTVEMSVLENEDVYSKQQAEQIIKNFFLKYPPASFQFVHQGGKEGNKFAIGEFLSKSYKFRITIYLKNEEKTALIYNLRIQYDNN